MSASCDTCRHPGACCKYFILSSENWAGTAWQHDWQSDVLQYVETQPHPFVPANIVVWPDEFREKDCEPYGTVYWTCKNLTSDGRCGDYENRPQLCRDYLPGQDALCVEHVLMFQGIPVLTQPSKP